MELCFYEEINVHSTELTSDCIVLSINQKQKQLNFDKYDIKLDLILNFANPNNPKSKQSKYIKILYTYKITNHQMQGQNLQTQTIGDYQLVTHPKLGQGATGKVFYGVNTKTKQKVAAKQIDTTKITSTLAKQIENEIKNLTKLNSPYIVKLYDYFKCGQYLYLFLEYCEDGDLKTYLDSKKGSGLCEAEALLFMKHIIEGYKELFQHKIIHRDIKPANILLKQGVAKLSDFGFSRVVDNPDMSQKLTLLGSPLYTAIQILKGNEFSSKCDVWSLGIVFYEMLQGRTPWTGKDLPDLKQNIQTRPLQFKQTLQNPKIKQLIHSMLKLQSKQRITWYDIFQHQLFQKIKTQKPQLTQQMSLQAIKLKFFQYMQTHMVKAYLRLNMSDVAFKQSYEPSEEKLKETVDKISKEITHKRNIAFLYLYVLALYYKNKDQGLFDEEVNRFMEFQYALVLRAYGLIYAIGKQYFGDKPTQQNSKEYQIFKNSSNYDELQKILSHDFVIVDTLKRAIKKHAVQLVTQKLLSDQAGKYFSALQKQFDKVFDKIMKHNEKELAKKANGVSNLIRDYIKNYIRDSSKLQDYSNLDMGAFYQNRQKAHGLV